MTSRSSVRGRPPRDRGRTASIRFQSASDRCERLRRAMSTILPDIGANLFEGGVAGRRQHGRCVRVLFKVAQPDAMFHVIVVYLDQRLRRMVVALFVDVL